MVQKAKKIVCVHLFNDYSGSPLVLSTVIKGFIQSDIPVDIWTSKNSEGFLSNLNVNYFGFKYKFYDNKLLRLFAYCWSQLILCLNLFGYRNEDIIIYVNTLLPFGASIAGKLMGKNVVYHIHETTVNPPILKSFLRFVATKTASKSIFVSKFLAEKEALPDVPSNVVYNALSEEFIAKSQDHYKTNQNSFCILMLCSLKAYKGVNEFITLADKLPQFKFNLVINNSEEEIRQYFIDLELPINLALFPSQSNVHPFYQKADLVLNLSHPEQWVETFGMTLLEAMQYGIPVIAPPVGGPTEIVKNDFNGYQIDQRNINLITQKITFLANNSEEYNRMSNNAKAYSSSFNTQNMQDKIITICFDFNKTIQLDLA